MAGYLTTVVVLNCCILGVMLAPVTNETDAAAYLVRFGYMKKSGEGMGTNMEAAVMKFQNMAGIPETGVVDDRTQDMMSKPRCGMADFPENQGTPSAGVWSKRSLTWSLENTTPDLSASSVSSALSGAFNKWQAASKLSFSKISGTSDIMVKFGSYSHGDSYPFDGRSGVLAHAYYPSSSSIGGDMHYDESETWSMSTGYGVISLPSVALHEAGHSLGLTHSSSTADIMYPYYSGDTALNTGDINRINALYP